jgi:protein phosphatase-4 regulatory subunit 3
MESESISVDQQQLQQPQQEVKAEVTEPTLNGVNGTIELVEHAPGTIAIEEAANLAEDSGEWVQEGDQMKRVKVRRFPPRLQAQQTHSGSL